VSPEVSVLDLRGPSEAVYYIDSTAKIRATRTLSPLPPPSGKNCCGFNSSQLALAAASCYFHLRQAVQLNRESIMATLGLVEYKDASPEVRAVYDDIMATRKVDWINNFWKAIARDPATLKRTWESIKQIMAPGALDPLTKEMLYVAVSVTNNCNYCIASHTAAARKKGMTDAMFHELQAVIGMANETNKLVTGYQVELDEQFKGPLSPLA
jgi:AhpD family alkylhydroperoxidase